MNWHFMSNEKSKYNISEYKYVSSSLDWRGANLKGRQEISLQLLKCYLQEVKLIQTPLFTHEFLASIIFPLDPKVFALC